MKQISILGCGWLGFPLAKTFLEKGFPVKGSTTSKAKLDLLEDIGIKPFLISLNPNEIEGDIAGFLQDSEILIIDIPPKLRNPENDSFVEKIKKLIPFIEKSSIKKVLFVSSTSVYGDTTALLTETEDVAPNPDTESGKQLFEVEKILQNNREFKTTVLRFAGLIGEDRHPVHFLAGRKNIENPDAPINLIHQQDCIGIILKIISQTEPDKVWGKIYNAAAPIHPSRKDYYRQKATALNLAMPEFNDANPSVGKTISSEKVIRDLNYVFEIPNL